MVTCATRSNWWCLKTYFIVLHCLAAKYLTYKITENKFVVYSFLIHDSVLFSINAFILSGVYQSTIPPILALLN